MNAASREETRGTLAIVAGAIDGPHGARERVMGAMRRWPGPVSLIVASPVYGDEAEGLPDQLALVVAGGEVAEALSPHGDTAHAYAAANALFEAATTRARLQHVLFLADESTLPLLPVFSAGAFPCPVDVELLPGADVPEPEALWEHADGVFVADDARLYALASGQPALPVRVIARGTEDPAEPLAELPAFGGTPRVSVIVPVRGQGDLVVRMAESVLERTPGLLELILVEDASPDRTLPKLEKLSGRDGRVRLFVHQEQHGFAASCNRGLMAARGDLVCVLNADTVVTPGWAERLWDHLLMQPKAGIVGPLSNRVSGLQQLAPVDYDERTLSGLVPFADRIARSARGRARGVVRLTGLCVAFSRVALRRVGGFDPLFFPGNFEDEDYCLRLIAGGLVPYCADDTYIHHEGSKSFALEPRSYRTILEENWSRFKNKWGLPADRPIERHYSPEELVLAPYVRGTHFIAPWRALEPVRVD